MMKRESIILFWNLEPFYFSLCLVAIVFIYDVAKNKYLQNIFILLLQTHLLKLNPVEAQTTKGRLQKNKSVNLGTLALKGGRGQKKISFFP